MSLLLPTATSGNSAKSNISGCYGRSPLTAPSGAGSGISGHGKAHKITKKNKFKKFIKFYSSFTR
jgi:hypothetical protein